MCVCERDRERCVCVLCVLVSMREKDCVSEGECVGICVCVYMKQRTRHARV